MGDSLWELPNREGRRTGLGVLLTNVTFSHLSCHSYSQEEKIFHKKILNFKFNAMNCFIVIIKKIQLSKRSYVP